MSKTTMRKTENAGWLSAPLKRSLVRDLSMAACVLGVGLCLAAGAARADDGDDEDDAFEDKIIRNIMSGLGGTTMDNKGINYRERSPLVVPRTIDLPPPETGSTTPANWPKDPTVAARKAEAEANKQAKPSFYESSRTLMPSELTPKQSKSARKTTTQQPGAPDGGQPGGFLMPSELGFSNSMLPSMFKGSSTEVGQFKGEPNRESLTEPPAGYRTPSPNYAYGTGAIKPVEQAASPGAQQKN